MKKILHISKFYYPYFGGIEDVVHSIVTEMEDKYEQHVICFNHENSGTIRTTNQGIEVIRVNAPIITSSQPLSMSYYRILLDEIDTFKPDIIHVHFPNPLIGVYLLMMPMKAKLVIHWHSDIIGKNILYGLYYPWERRILDRADAIIATSKQYISHSAPLRAHEQKTHILPNIVNEEKLQPQAGDEAIIESIRERYEGKKIILFVGRHVPYKGIDILVKATSYLPKDYVVLIGGTGEQTANLQQLAAPLGDQVQFLGRLQDKELRCYLRAADVFAFPSIDRREAFGVALAEALYCGLPAVSFLIPGSGSIWVNQHEQTGLVVDTIDVASYANALKSLLEDDARRKQYSDAAAQWVKDHFLKDQIQTLPAVYESC
jgi:rhamnosyl/mannosyltransferase